ncbi:MAG: hypothetical protein EOM02_06425 [Synergistales bacterium]|nr:hypothetical protein [Synergistales bacterium]
MGIEIEKKYFCKVLDVPRGRRYMVDQRYLLANHLLEFRFRSVGGCCYFTVKTGEGMVRGEWEWSIPRWLFCLIGKICPWGVRKTRYVVGPWEVDIYPDLHGFAVAEVELASSLAQVPKIPEWLEILEDITLDSRWKNKKLAQDGFPKRRNEG